MLLQVITIYRFSYWCILQSNLEADNVVTAAGVKGRWVNWPVVMTAAVVGDVTATRNGTSYDSKC